MNLTRRWHHKSNKYVCSADYIKLVCVLVSAKGKPPFGRVYCSARYGVRSQAAPAERFNVFGCGPWPAMFGIVLVGMLINHWHNESSMHRYSAEKLTKLVCLLVSARQYVAVFRPAVMDGSVTESHRGQRLLTDSTHEVVGPVTSPAAPADQTSGAHRPRVPSKSRAC